MLLEEPRKEPQKENSRFTDKLIKSLKPKPQRYDVREKSGQGFGIRVFPSNQKSWVFLYHFEGKKKRMTLGTYPLVSLNEARQKHFEALRVLSSGKDPNVIKQETQLASKNAETIPGLIEEYLEKWAKKRKRSWKEDERILKKDVLSVWGKKKAKDIKKHDVISLLDKVIERGSPIAANRTLAVIRKMFNFAVERSILPITPCYNMKAPALENQRDRVLSFDEIRFFWVGLDKFSCSELIKLALKLQLTTAQRKGEVVSAEWKEMDLKTGWWTIPSHKAKNRNAHRVPLSKLALSLLVELKKYSGHTSWLFPSRVGNQSLTGSSIDHALLKNLQILDSAKSFTPHDK
ncbi:tyrosine-type recombinase/integrase [Rickettsiella endosymbiont of Dermanyssus gallinae]|uniref:tyrosine-type recombinase/integrase n=1 Tax=Rickettsiella endosymbiont of Dermanyssus gallinae TaxID=2856608 RepID=UPI001C53255C|nr:integrase arm-type DNA-binding domain-containing protein [Rickettsiella endosymbiont of Dermanyssus gallinae]